MDLIVLMLIGVNVLVSYLGFQDYHLIRRYEFYIRRIRSGEQYRLITSAFLHADWMHLIFNMYTLYMFAPIVIGYAGSLFFVFIYFASLIFGSLLTMYIHKKDENYRAIGASGAVMGVVYSAIMFEPGMTLFLFVIPVPAFLFAIGYLLYSIYGMRAKLGQVGHAAHFGGAMGGYVITLFKFPMMMAEHTLLVVLLVLPIIILFIMEKAGKL